MENKFNTPEEERAYQLGRLDGILYYQQTILKNVKSDYEKVYQKKQELDNSRKK